MVGFSFSLSIFFSIKFVRCFKALVKLEIAKTPILIKNRWGCFRALHSAKRVMEIKCFIVLVFYGQFCWFGVLAVVRSRVCGKDIIEVVCCRISL